MASSGSVGTLSWSAKLDSNEFKKGVRKVKKQMKEAQKSVKESIKVIASSFAVATGAIGGMTIALGAMVVKSSEAIREIENLAKVADTSFSDFIKMSEGAKRFGIESEKLSDILKDMKDRVGDFIATGGGPMKDFFEQIAPKIGITADAFKDLSGKDSLQLFFNSLEKANLSQAEMVFYLEAMASDLTLLQPLLKDNGKLFKQFGLEAEKAGLILPDDKVQDLKDAMMGFDKLSTQITASIQAVSAELAPVFTSIADDITNVLRSSDVEIKELFTAMGDYFSLTIDGMRFSLENAGIIDEFYTWQDAFLDIAFFLRNTWGITLLGMFKATEKILSFISTPVRQLYDQLFNGLRKFTMSVRDLLKMVKVESEFIDEFIQDLKNVEVALDAEDLFGAFDGALSGTIEDELKKSEKLFRESIKRIKNERKKSDSVENKDLLSDAINKSGGSIFGSMFKGINKGMEAIKSGIQFMSQPNEFFTQGMDEFNDKDEPKDVVRSSNVLATAGSVEEFNLISAQRKEELTIAKKQLKALQGIEKNQATGAGFTK